MNYLITGGNEKLRFEKAASLGIPISSENHIKSSGGSIGIDAIRALKNGLATKQAKPTLILIDPAQNLTIPAQNSFLKLLEESPHNINFGLGVVSADSLLRTIVSRCIIIKIKQEMAVSASPESIALAKQLLQLVGGGVTEALSYKNKIKKDLKGGAAEQYFNVWLCLMRDATHLRYGIDQTLTFVILKDQIEQAFAAWPKSKIISVANRLQYLQSLIETSNIGPDRAASVFLLQLCNSP